MSVLKKPHILLIEDFVPLATSLKAYLEANDYAVTVMDNHDDAFARLQNEKSFAPDMIICDEKTHGPMNGETFIKAREWPMPIIAFGAHIIDNRYMQHAGATVAFDEKTNLSGTGVSEADQALLALVKAQLQTTKSR